MFINNVRYLDDVLDLNNLELKTFAKEIYPYELTLNKSNISYESFSLFRFGFENR